MICLIRRHVDSAAAVSTTTGGSGCTLGKITLASLPVYWHCPTETASFWHYLLYNYGSKVKVLIDYTLYYTYCIVSESSCEV